MNSKPVELAIVETLKGHVRVNEANKTVEIYDDHGVKLVLRNLDDTVLEAFKKHYPSV